MKHSIVDEHASNSVANIEALMKKEKSLKAKIKQLNNDYEYYEDHGAYFSADYALEDIQAAKADLKGVTETLKKIC